jgi:hypothetical protein
MHNDHFYHRTTRKMVVTFGNLFNNIPLVKYTQDGLTEISRMTVPIVYGVKEKWMQRLAGDPDLTRSVQVVLPRMSFKMGDPQYDPSRKQQQTLTVSNTDTTDGHKKRKQYVGVPYNFPCTLSIYARNLEDGLQIVEQIVPYFNPDFNVNVELIPSIGPMGTKSIPVVLNSVTSNADDEGTGDTMRVLWWDLQFVMKGYFYGPVSSVGYIRQANTNVYDTTSESNRGATLTVSTDGFANFQDTELVFQGNTFDDATAIGTVKHWDNTNHKLFVTVTSGRFIANANVVGVQTGADWSVSSIDSSPIKTVVVVVTPNPATANVGDDYGYTTVINEFPNT